MPEGKSSHPGRDENAVELFIGKADVDGLVLLQDWVDALAALMRCELYCATMQGRGAVSLRVGIVFRAKKFLIWRLQISFCSAIL